MPAVALTRPIPAPPAVCVGKVIFTPRAPSVATLTSPPGTTSLLLCRFSNAGGAPAAAVLAVAALLHRAVRARPCLALAVAWFGFSLIPVLQLVPMDVVYADRYLYFALPGAIASESLLFSRQVRVD